MRVLVTGGAGYIGGHTVRELINRGHKVTVLDNLSHGHINVIDPRANFVQGDLEDTSLLIQRLKVHQIEAVMHFAGSTDIDESIKNPYLYYRNNVSHFLNLLRAMQIVNVKKIIYSSSAAVYGNPVYTPIEEHQKLHPLNPYGRSKMMAELVLQDFHRAHGLSGIILRYFNVAGASSDAALGEDHRPEKHLIPRLLRAARDGGEVKIFGTDFSTRDGTMVRDFLHVVDVAQAHILSLENITTNRLSVYNLGSEAGFSMKEIIAACELASGKKLQVTEEKRIPGDPASLVVNSLKIRRDFGWRPLYPTIHAIVQHAWLWQSTHPDGYSSPENSSFFH